MQASDWMFQPLDSDISIGEPEDSQEVSLLDSDQPLFPFNPIEIIEKNIPNLIPNLDPISPLFDFAPTVRPICEGNLFPFCCNQGPPNPVSSVEKQKRRRKCYNCRSRVLSKTL